VESCNLISEMNNLRPALFLIFFALIAPCASTQTTARPPMTELAAAGDQPDDPGPLATGLSAKLKHRDIQRAMKLVADWQIKHSDDRYNIDWTYAALYDGLLAASRTTGDRRYHDWVLKVARDYKWQLAPRFAHADDEAIGLTYLTFYNESHNPEELAPTREGMDKLIARPDDPGKNLWWWCDALYMSPKVLAELSRSMARQSPRSRLVPQS
jgi:unsaturated rhamnogalacturonyl hydrolase